MLAGNELMEHAFEMPLAAPVGTFPREAGDIPPLCVCPHPTPPPHAGCQYAVLPLHSNHLLCHASVGSIAHL